MNTRYTGPERRKEYSPQGEFLLSESQMDAIAEKAADRAVEKVTDLAFKTVGKSIVEKFVWLVGVIAVGAYLYLQAKGVIK